MIRVLYIINNLDVGGAERHLLQVLPRLSDHNIAPTIYTISYKGELAPEFEKAGVRVIAPPFSENLRHWPKLMGRPLLMIGAAWRLWILMWSLRPQIVHFFLPHAYIFGGGISLLYRGATRIMSRRSLNDYQLRHPVTGKFERLLHPFMTAVLGNSKRVCSQLAEEGIVQNRLGLIYNGLDLTVFDNTVSRNVVRSRLGIDNDALVLVLVANLIFYKGHEDLLKALALVRDDLPPGWRILCVGRDTGIGPGLKKQAQELGIDGHVQWLGERRDTADLLCASDIGLLVSHEEGFSNSVLEGMACGLPMVVTNVGGNPEAVQDGGNGFLVPPQDFQAIGQAILKFAHDAELRSAMGESGQARVRKLFTIERCVAQYAVLYQAVTSSNEFNVPDVLDGQMQ